MNYDQDDIHSLALVAWKEARGETPHPDGCIAVMQVILNRIGYPGFTHTLHDVIYGKNQFTSMSVPSDPEFNLQPNDDDSTFKACMDNAVSILANFGSSDYTDITKGAHYYANLHTMDQEGWFYRNIVQNSATHPITVQIGRHTFFV